MKEREQWALLASARRAAACRCRREWLLLCGTAGAIAARLGIAFFSYGTCALRDNFISLTANWKGEKRTNTGWLLSAPLGPWHHPQEWGAGPAECVLAVPPGTCEVGRGQCPSLGAVCVLAQCSSPVALVARAPWAAPLRTVYLAWPVGCLSWDKSEFCNFDMGGNVEEQPSPTAHQPGI